MTNISRCCYILHLRVCRLSRGSRCHHSQILQHGGCRNGSAYCVVHSTIHWPAGGHAGGASSAGLSTGSGSSHCSMGPHANVPQSASAVTGESS
jgi:hypothetical protein